MNNLSFKSRSELPHTLNARGLKGLAVEVGVHRGVHAAAFRAAWDGLSLLLVDPWTPYGDVSGGRNAKASDVAAMEANYAAAVGALCSIGRPFDVVRLPSLAAASAFPARARLFDFVYLDADHSYEAVAADIAAWLPLVRPGGIIAGHDYVPDGWHPYDDPITAVAEGAPNLCGPFGVKRAVDERFDASEVAISSPDCDEGWRSWAVVVRS